MYLEGRPSAHPFHRKAALNLLPVRIQHIDLYFRWQDKKKPFIRRTLSWLLSPFLLKQKKDINLFWIDGLHVFPVLMKKFRLINRQQKIIAHMGSHTLYFTYAGFYSKMSAKLNKYLLEQYDGFICEGKMAQELILSISPATKAKTYVSFLGPDKSRFNVITKKNPLLTTKKIFYVGSFDSEFRVHYKGIDLLIQAFDKVRGNIPDLELVLIGSYTDKIRKDLLKNSTSSFNITFAGLLEEPFEKAEDFSLYVHPSRGDAFPTATIEAMCSGVPVIISKWTGTKEIIEEVTEEMVCELEPSDIAAKIEQYFLLPLEEKYKIRDKQRSKAMQFNEENALIHYRQIFEQIKLDFFKV